jgi:hypothetical protein
MTVERFNSIVIRSLENCRRAVCTPKSSHKLRALVLNVCWIFVDHRSFSAAPDRLFVRFKRYSRRSGGRPAGPELLREAAERGHCPEAKPNGDGLKGRRTYKKSNAFNRFFSAGLQKLSDVHGVLKLGISILGIGEPLSKNVS